MYKKCAQTVDKMRQNYVQEYPQNPHFELKNCVKNELSKLYTALNTHLENSFRRICTAKNDNLTGYFWLLSTLSPQPITITTKYINNK